MIKFLSTFFSVFCLSSIMYSQKSNLSFGFNYSWLEKIESTTESRQVFSPGFIFSYGYQFLPNEKKIGLYINTNLNWMSGGVMWRYSNDPSSYRSKYNGTKFELDNGVLFCVNERSMVSLGICNSFGVKIKSDFGLSEQNTFRNWSPQIVSRYICITKPESRWGISFKIAVGLRTVSYIESNFQDIKLRYESSNSHTAIEIRRYFR